MTDTSSLATTHSTADPYPVTAPLNSPAPNGAVSDSVQLEDDEPYTIKCICTFEDDDGNTVFCEGCETWQHIECYYHGREVPEVHNCTDCEPRYLDGRRATERQRRLREQGDGGDRKAKRSGSKTQKKKSKDQDPSPLVNGHHQRSDSSSRDQPLATKKPRTSHKPSASLSALSGSPALQPDRRKRSGSNTTSMSPSKSSAGSSIPLYSSEFVHLYANDRGHVDMESNLFVNLTLAADLASWVKDPTALSRVVNGRSPQDIFTRAEALDCSTWPALSTDSITDQSLQIDGLHPMWKVLKTPTTIHKDEIVGEVKGKIGLLRDYCHDPSNRWQELRHPQPFVFFHPQLPIYIDSREEGSVLRYIRRSCRPNVTMKTLITNDVEYHFCFVANQDIPAGSEVSATWYLDPQLFGSSNGLVKEEAGDNLQEAAAVCISNVLAHFGGCACNSASTCLLAAVDRRRHPGVKQLNGKRRKPPKSKSNVSPLDAGRSSASRAGSEGIKNLDDDDNADNRSTSGSVRGRTHSRDLTPTQSLLDWTAGDAELSARDRRKIAAVEKKFEQLEHDQHQTGQRKKKRSNAQSAQTTPTLPTSKQAGYFGNPGFHVKSLHVDTAASRQSNSPPSSRPSTSGGPYYRPPSPRKTSGPNTPSVRSPLARPSYVDAAHQTESDQGKGSTPSPHRFCGPLGRRLLKRCHEESGKFQWASKRLDRAASSTLDVAMSPGSPGDVQFWASGARPTSGEGEDVEMKDADSETTPLKSSTVGPGYSRFRSPDIMSKPPLPSPLPSTAAHNTLIPGRHLNGGRSGLHVQLPPNNFALPMTNTPGSMTPASLQSPLDPFGSLQPLQTPGGSIAAPSPVKKKLSLGDYLSRRGTLTTPTSEKSQSQASSGLPPPRKAGPQLQSTTPPLSADGQMTGTTTGPEGVKTEGSPDVAMKDVSNPPLSPPYPPSVGVSDHTKLSPSS